MRSLVVVFLLLASTVAVIQPAQGAECIAFRDGDCVEPDLPAPSLLYSSLLPENRFLQQLLDQIGAEGVELPVIVVDPNDACQVGKQDICVLLQELINCEDCLDLPPVEDPDIVATILAFVEKACQRQNCDPNDVIPQDLIDQLQDCLKDDDCIPTPDLIQVITATLVMVLAIVGEQVEAACEKAQDCDLNKLIVVAQGYVDQVVEAVCGSTRAGDCDPSHLLPDYCLNRPVDIPVIVPGQVQDADGDGVPGIRYTESTVTTDGCYTNTQNGPGGTLPAPDPDDGDASTPIPNPEDICRQLVTATTTSYADTALVADNDGDGVPSITVPIYTAGVDGSCNPELTQTGEYHIGPDPDDEDPSNPVNPAYCDMREGFTITLPGQSTLHDDDQDLFPVIVYQNTKYTLNSDCTLQEQDAGTSSVAIDPDDSDNQNPVASDKPACEDFTTTRWLPGGVVQEDNDADGIPVIGLQEREYEVDEDCNVRATGNQRVNSGFVTGDPDDADPDVPVPREIEPCSNVDSTQFWVPWIPTTRDDDGDDVPVVTMRERLIIQHADCTAEPTTQYRSGSEYGDPDDGDPNNPGVSCDGLDMPEGKVPTGGVRTKDDDGDSIPQTGYTVESLHLGSDCNITFSDPEVVWQPYPDPDDEDANVPAPFAEPCQNLEAPSFQVVGLGRISDDDGDRVPLIHTQSQTFWLQSDCTVEEGDTSPGPSYGDPDDNDIDNPIPTNPQVCQNLDVTTVPVYNPPTVQDLDGDQVPWLHFTYDEKTINPDCTVAPGPTNDAGGIGDPDDADPYNPIPDPGAVCQDIEEECAIEFTQPTGNTRSTDADYDGVPVIEAESQTYRLRYNPANPEHTTTGDSTWSVVGGDPDDADPDVPVPREVTPCAGLMVPAIPLPIGVPVAEDQDGDDVPNYKQTFEDHELAGDCTWQGNGDLQTIGFGPDPDDQDPTNPPGIFFPCSSLESPFYVPSSYRIDDADNDRVPIAVVIETRYTISGDCNVVNTGQTRDSPLGPVGDPDDANDQVPLPGPDACQGRPAPCELASIPLPTPCNVRDNDQDNIAQADICTTTLVMQSNGQAFFHDPVKLYGPVGDLDDQDGDRPVPYSIVNLLDEILEDSIEEVNRILGDIDDRQDQLIRLLNNTVEATEEDVWAVYAELLQVLDFAANHLSDTADRAVAFVACTTASTESHAALVQNRVDAYFQNPNETTYAQFLDAGIEGSNAYLLNMRECNEPSRILAYGVEEMQYQCAAANHIIMEGARIVQGSQDPVYDLERIFQPGTDRTTQTLTGCLDAPGQFLIELAKLMERSAESAQYALISYADPEGTDFLDDLRHALGVQDEPEPASTVTRFSLPFSFALLLVLIAAAIAVRRR